MPGVVLNLSPSRAPAPAPCGVRTRSGREGPGAAWAPPRATLQAEGWSAGGSCKETFFCPLAPTPETKGANAPRDSQEAQFETREALEAAPTRAHCALFCLRAGPCLGLWAREGWTLLGKDPSRWSREPKGASSLFRVGVTQYSLWESHASWRD